MHRVTQVVATTIVQVQPGRAGGGKEGRPGDHHLGQELQVQEVGQERAPWQVAAHLVEWG